MFQLVPVPLDQICICLVVLFMPVVVIRNAGGQTSSQQLMSDPLFLPVERGDRIDAIYTVSWVEISPGMIK